MPGRPLVLASSRTPPNATEEIAAGLRPRLDYLELAAALGGDVLDTRAGDAQPPWRRRVERALSSDIRQSQVAWGRRGLSDAFVSASEKVGLPLALRRPGRPHVLIAHNLTSARKRQLHQLTGVLRWGFSGIVCLSSVQERYLRDEVGLPQDRVHRLNDNVDTRFFRPDSERDSDGGYLLAVGRENRDYQTLIAAARMLEVPTVIIASSLWAMRGGVMDETDLPPNVTVRRDFLSYPELRDLYAGARAVAVPLHDVPYAAGVNGLMEAMAMGKATVVTQTAGLADYLAAPGALRAVPAADPAALAAAVGALWENAPARAALGRAARAVAEEEMSMERYVDGVAAVARRAASQVSEGRA